MTGKPVVPFRNSRALGAAVDYHHVAYLFAVATGIVTSGLIASLWSLATDGASPWSGLEEPDLLTPLRALVLVFSAPTALLSNGSYYLIAQPLIGLILLFLGVGWSFVQGIVILSKIFGVT